jgi:hypothetical protein
MIFFRTGEHYLHLTGGTVRFERLEMRDADMNIVDSNRGPWFDFYLDRYHDQLAASTDKVSPNGALQVAMPDYGQIAKLTASRSQSVAMASNH